MKRLVVVLAVAVLSLGLAAAPPGSGAGAPRPVQVVIEAAPVGHLAAALPATVRFSDRMGTAQVALLETPLTASRAPELASYRAGDVGYWAAGRALVVFLHDGSGAAEDVYLVGRVTRGMPELSDCAADCPVQLIVQYRSTT